jgi:DNA-binding transcriptional LysR family regulator
MVKWDDYEAFCWIAERGGFTSAARYLNVPKSNLSAAVARLEAGLNTRLLERNTRAVRLTEAGRSLFGSINPLFNQLRDARDRTVLHSREIGGTLRLAAPYEFSAHHLGAVACRIMQRHPKLNIQIDMRYAQAGLLDENYDIVFSMVDRELPASNVIARRVFSLEQAIYASPDLIARHGAPECPADLGKLPVIGSSADTAWTFFDRDHLEETVALAVPRLRSANADVRLQAGIAGIGVVRITATYCHDAVERGVLVRLLPRYLCAPVSVFAIYPSRQLVPLKVRAFLDALTGISDRT